MVQLGGYMLGLMGNIMKLIFGMETLAEEFSENMKHAKSD